MGLSNEQAVESFAGQVFGVSTGIAAAVLATIDLLEEVFEKKPSAPRSKYAMAVSRELLGLSIELLAIPILEPRERRSLSWTFSRRPRQPFRC